jgi:hypothetical protein
VFATEYKSALDEYRDEVKKDAASHHGANKIHSELAAKKFYLKENVKTNIE